MKQKLIPFEPDCPFTLEGQLDLSKDQVNLSWVLGGDTSLLEREDFGPSLERKIGLWNQTCFEYFIKSSESDHYLEFNFSTEGSWNAFHFRTYRGELQEELSFKTPKITYLEQTYQVTFQRDEFPSGFLHLGINQVQFTAILKTMDGKTFHMAPEHPEEAPDFHKFQHTFH